MILINSFFSPPHNPLQLKCMHFSTIFFVSQLHKIAPPMVLSSWCIFTFPFIHDQLLINHISGRENNWRNGTNVVAHKLRSLTSHIYIKNLWLESSIPINYKIQMIRFLKISRLIWLSLNINWLCKNPCNKSKHHLNFYFVDFIFQTSF